MHGGIDLLRLISIVSIVIVSVLCVGTVAIAVFYRREIRQAERRKARVQLGLDKTDPTQPEDEEKKLQTV